MQIHEGSAFGETALLSVDAQKGGSSDGRQCLTYTETVRASSSGYADGVSKLQVRGLFVFLHMCVHLYVVRVPVTLDLLMSVNLSMP